MKQLLALLILLIGLPVAGSAQSISIGTRQGVGLNQLFATGNGFARDFAINQEFNPGYMGGIVVRHMSNQTVGFQGGLLYAGKGWTQLLDNGQSFSTNLNYVEVEGLTHLQFGKGNFKFFLQGGIFGGYALSASDNLSDIEDHELIRYQYDIDVDNRLNFGLKGGGGFSLDSQIGLFQVNFLFGQALGSLIDTSTTTRALFTQVQTVEVGVTYLIPIISER
ncbi:porin family protein [Roseivirga sp. BDSF3-8]|uniref:porin family protein n=1 Tax=Roseivirga sp. BDSF3-8 TaxID=3241598 RepID=UPI0035318EF1